MKRGSESPLANTEIVKPFGTCGSQPFGRATVCELLSTAGVA